MNKKSPTTTEDIFEEYSRIAPSMELVKPKCFPKIHYHLLADAIYWSDEIPERDVSDFSENCMRFVIRYRTTLILGEPDPKWEPYYEEAKRQFPKWIGFQKKRNRPSNRLKKIYLFLKEVAEKSSFGFSS